MKTRLLALMFLAGTAAFAGPRVFVGVGFGAPAPVVAYAPPPAPVVRYAVPPSPGPGYAWVGGYYYPVGPRYVWRPGYWAHRPRYYSGHYYGGYWRR